MLIIHSISEETRRPAMGTGAPSDSYGVFLHTKVTALSFFCLYTGRERMVIIHNYGMHEE